MDDDIRAVPLWLGGPPSTGWCRDARRARRCA